MPLLLLLPGAREPGDCAASAHQQQQQQQQQQQHCEMLQCQSVWLVMLVHQHQLLLLHWRLLALLLAELVTTAPACIGKNIHGCLATREFHQGKCVVCRREVCKGGATRPT
jgi:hypothetical protein